MVLFGRQKFSLIHKVLITTPRLAAEEYLSLVSGKIYRTMLWRLKKGYRVSVNLGKQISYIQMVTDFYPTCNLYVNIVKYKSVLTL